MLVTEAKCSRPTTAHHRVDRAGDVKFGVVRIFLGAVVWAAAALKLHQLAVDAPSISVSVGFLAIVLVVEFLIAGLMITGIWQHQTRLIAIGCFLLFSIVSAYAGYSGASSCGCFGRLSVNPWHVFTFDVVAVISLTIHRPPRTSKLVLGRSLLETIGIIICFGGVSAGISLLATHREGEDETGVTRGDGFVLLEPEKWINREFPLFTEIEINAPIRLGSWIVVLFHRDCMKCQELLSGDRYERASPIEAARVAFVEVSATSGENEWQPTFPSDCAAGRLSDSVKWYVRTPVELLLKDGNVIDVTQR